MTRGELPRLIPTGTCWCGCGKDTSIGSFFARGHDKIAEAALVAAEYGGSVAQLLQKYGYNPGRPVIVEAVRAGNWVDCKRVALGRCWYRGTPESVRKHMAKYQHG